MKRSFALLVPILLVIVFLHACSQRQQAWEEARAANTPEAYEAFVASFPDGEFASQARARAAELRETRDWQKAIAANSLDAYRQFVKLHPDGSMSDEARIRIESFALSAPVPDSAPGLATLAGPTTIAPADAGNSTQARSTASGGSNTSSAAPAASAASARQGYRIQLGAFAGGEKQAMNEWRQLQEEFPALLRGLKPTVRLATTTSGHLYRLQAGFTDEPRARAICERLKEEGRACVVVLP